jgi:two-component system, OmpR family, phosphate regulon sensor histidine kinase PhoR
LFNSVRWRMIVYYLAVIAVIVIMMGAFFIWFVNYFYMQGLRENLYIQARLTAGLVEQMSESGALPEEIDAMSKRLGDELDLRLTYIDSDGFVIADSSENPALMDNHLDRPEVMEALRGDRGEAVRYSVTLDQDMYYLAVPANRTGDQGEDGGTGAVVRLALPLVRIDQAVFNLKLFIVGALLIASLVALAAAILLSEKITGPIRRISNASKAMAGGDYTPVLQVSGRDEIADLAGNIKDLGIALRKKIDQVLFEKNRLETVISSMGSGIILTDRDLNIELINPAAENLFDVKQAEVSGKQLQAAIRDYSLNESLKAIRQDGRARLIELNLYYPRPVVAEAHLFPVTGADKKMLGTLLVFYEVTHLRSIEKMRSDFVANVSHEMRTPLTAVLGYTETILHEDLTREQLLDFMQIIDREANRLSRLLDDLLDLAKIENEKEFIKKKAVDLPLLIREAVQRVEDLLQVKKDILAVDLPDQDLLIEGNAEWLRQGLVNIIENSVRHGRKEGIVTIKLIEEDANAVVEIGDDGPGIPEADLPYVFERFYRVDKARSRKSGGTGLGLAIVKHILEAHGSIYTLESREGEGTLFRFTLPLYNPQK